MVQDIIAFLDADGDGIVSKEEAKVYISQMYGSPLDSNDFLFDGVQMELELLAGTRDKSGRYIRDASANAYGNDDDWIMSFHDVISSGVVSAKELSPSATLDRMEQRQAMEKALDKDISRQRNGARDAGPK